MNPLMPWREVGLDLRQGDPFVLVLIFAPSGFVTDLTGLALKEDELDNPFPGIDAAVGTGGVGKL